MGELSITQNSSNWSNVSKYGTPVKKGWRSILKKLSVCVCAHFCCRALTPSNHFKIKLWHFNQFLLNSCDRQPTGRHATKPAASAKLFYLFFLVRLSFMWIIMWACVSCVNNYKDYEAAHPAAVMWDVTLWHSVKIDTDTNCPPLLDWRSQI